MIDPREPLYGKRLCLERVARTSPEVANVFLRRPDGVVLRVPLRATSLSKLVDHDPRAKLSKQAAQEFLDLVKEYELCPLTNTSKQTKSGRRSTKKRGKKS